MTQMPLTDKAAEEFLGGRSLLWTEVARKAMTLIKAMGQLERDRAELIEVLEYAYEMLECNINGLVGQKINTILERMKARP